MRSTTRSNIFLGMSAGIGLTALAGVLMGQSASQPVKSETQYFVTGEADAAHLWVREGASLRCVGHGECKAHAHEHKEGDGHHHGEEAPKK